MQYGPIFSINIAAVTQQLRTNIRASPSNSRTTSRNVRDSPGQNQLVTPKLKDGTETWETKSIPLRHMLTEAKSTVTMKRKPKVWDYLMVRISLELLDLKFHEWPFNLYQWRWKIKNMNLSEYISQRAPDCSKIDFYLLLKYGSEWVSFSYFNHKYRIWKVEANHQRSSPLGSNNHQM